MQEQSTLSVIASKLELNLKINQRFHIMITVLQVLSNSIILLRGWRIFFKKKSNKLNLSKITTQF